jgi:hypothetical protein
VEGPEEVSYAYADLGFTKEERAALKVTTDDLRALTPEQRIDYTLRHREIKAQERAAFWDAIASAMPVLIALGFGAWLGGKKK